LEDDLDLQLNLEGILVNGSLTLPKLIRLRAETRNRLRKGTLDGERIKAADFDLPPFIRLLNPDHHIATVRRGAPERGSFNIELLLARGLGNSDRENSLRFLPSGFYPLNVDFRNIVAYYTSSSMTAKEEAEEKPLTTMEWMSFHVFMKEGFVFPDEDRDKRKLTELSLEGRYAKSLRRIGVLTLGELVRCSKGELSNLRTVGEVPAGAIEDWLVSEYSIGLRGRPRISDGLSVLRSGVKASRDTFKTLQKELSDKKVVYLTNEAAHQSGGGIPPLSVLRCARVLKRSGISTPEELMDRSAVDLLNIKGFGPGSLKDVEAFLKSHGGSLRKD
jgi:DNA-directed RNA polymerase alpha subunit